MDEQSKPEQPSTAEVLAEVERRRAEARPSIGEERRRAVIVADRFVFWLSKHWLAVFNTIAFLYVGLPVLAPILEYAGLTGPAAVIYVIYGPLCHQMPERSFFLFGPKFTYTLEELIRHTGLESRPVLAETALLVRAVVGHGDETLGYKFALCQRDTAIYGMIFLFGLLYDVLRKRRLRPLPFWAYVTFGILPMLIDGGYQWLTFSLLPFLYHEFPSLAETFYLKPHETIPLFRVITGALFGLATVWLAYPYVQEAMDDFRETLHKRFGWK
jgi:uncharacterized membrane protein